MSSSRDEVSGSQRSPVERPPILLAQAGLGLAILVVAGTIVDGNRSPGAERAVFHAINSMPSLLYWPFWAVMQLGNLVALPIAAVLSAFTRRFRLAVGILAALPIKLYVALLIKDNFLRQRPASVIDDVTRRGDVSATGRAFVSGHAIVVFALAALLLPYLSKRWRLAVLLVAAVVCIARVYVGAHLPLDVIGGAAIGWTIGSTANYILGIPNRSEDDLAS
jgi:undecaprenyl-diphosphatase